MKIRMIPVVAFLATIPSSLVWAAPYEGAPAETLAETLVATSAQARPTVDLRVCNRSGRSATVAVSFVQPGEDRFINRGWYNVANGACRDLVTTDNRNFYLYADATDGSERNWQGGHNLCVEYPGPYVFYSDSSNTCRSHQEVRRFTAFTAEEPGTWTWTLNP